MQTGQPNPESAAQVIEQQNLRAQLALVNRLHLALRATLDPDDLIQVILAALVSEFGLGFDHAFFLEYIAADNLFRGRAAMGCKSHEQHITIRGEILEEQQWLKDRVDRLSGKMEEDHQSLLASLELKGLQANSFWIETVQKYMECNDLDFEIKTVEMPCEEKEARVLCQMALLSAHSAIELTEENLPQGLRAFITYPSVAAPIITERGLYGITIADMGFSRSRSISQHLLPLFEWFVGQSSIAMNQALLYGRKQGTIDHLREIDTIKSNFLSTISHELRTPLTAISGFVQLLLNNRAGRVSDQQGEFLKRIQRHTDHLSEVVDDLIELAEANSDPSEDTLKSVDPLMSLMKVVPRLEHRRRGKHVHIEPVFSGKVPEVLATERSMERILFHLLDNAVKFSPDSGRVTVAFLPVPSARLRIEVRDKGIGIAEKNLKQIFEGFYQVDNRLIRKYQGLGIGLTLTKKQLMAIDGTIDVKSRLGEGTTVVVELRTSTPQQSSAESAIG